MKYIFAVLVILTFVGCSSKEAKIEIEDLVNIPQDVKYFTKNIDENVTLYEVQKEFDRYYFSMWNIEKPNETLEGVQWPFRSYRTGKSYGENLQLLEQKFFDEMYENSNFDSFLTLNKRALTIKHVNLRAFPTIRPLLKDPSLAGEGFPFDYLQNSTVCANKPILVSHYSKDRKWIYVFSSFANGWIQADEMVFIEKEHTDLWQNAQQVFIVKENIPITNEEGNFLFYSKIGMMLALVDEDDDNYTVLAVSAYKNNQAQFLQVKISKEIARKGILSLNKTNLELIIGELSTSNYGWGGMYEQRDCSSTLRDLFTPFGIWLARNSSMQSRKGKVISLENLSNNEKIEQIKKEAVPFQTLLYKRGHIVLYVGSYNDEIIIFHNTWGVKTKKNGVEGRVVIGKSLFSTLKLGKKQKNYDEEGEILKNLKSMNILTQKN
ncbi:SH3 domain-containing protein [bacterium]|nr:SH3 domain-containing protein [bacterium]MBU1995449.1 SH3 domain-containing protein [bacterium]